ncbi:uncharacterized protein LOC141654924 [Silene latifolia]|uniref:uncharacterized protein LOC141654924 n=1 Tax=Silene latifolia TaxID=37657 RepID=UPI003D777603
MKKPAEGHADHQKWIQVDYMVTNWILNTIVEAISGDFDYILSSKQLWDDLVERYGQTNGPRYFEIGKELYNLQQGNLSMAEYYGRMKYLWEELQNIEGIPECVCGVLEKCSCSMIKRFIEAENNRRLIQFLMGVDPAYDTLRQLLLAHDPLPTLNQAFSRLLQAESQRSVSLKVSPVEESTALYVAKNFNQRSFNTSRGASSNATRNVFPGSTENKDYRDFKKPKVYNKEGKEEEVSKPMFCRYCKKDNHNIENCRQLEYKRRQQGGQEGRSYGNPGNSRFAAFASEESPDDPLELDKNSMMQYRPSFSHQSDNNNFVSRAGQGQGQGQSAHPSVYPMGIDENYLASVIQRVVKNMNITPQTGKSTSTANFANFAGMHSALSATNVHIESQFKHWIIDTGASDHMSPWLSLFMNLRKLNHYLCINLPDGRVKTITQIGDIRINASILLRNVLFVPDFRHNLLSVGRLAVDSGLQVLFDNKGCLFQDPTTKTNVAYGVKDFGLYKLLVNQASLHQYTRLEEKNICSSLNHVSKQLSTVDPHVSLLHARLGHSSVTKMLHVPGNMCKSVTKLDCEICLKSKFHQFPFPKSQSRALHVFDLVHVDLWGPYKIPNISGATYFLTILDDHTRTTWTHLLKDKYSVYYTISAFIAYVKNQFHTTIKQIRSDNGTEIVQGSCARLFADKGIVLQHSIPGVPQQNGRVERKHRHLLETTRAIRFHANLPKRFWGKCLLAATHIINLLPSSVLNWKIPIELLFYKEADYSSLKVVGYLCYAYNRDIHRDKFDSRARRSILLGYPHGTKGYKLYDLDNNKVFLSRDVRFYEHIFPFQSSSKGIFPPHESLLPLVNSIPNDVHISSNRDSADIHSRSTDTDISPGVDIHSSPGNSDIPSSTADAGILNARPLITEPRKSSRPRQLSTRLQNCLLPNLYVLPNSNISNAFNVNTICSSLHDHSPEFKHSLANVLAKPEPITYS